MHSVLIRPYTIINKTGLRNAEVISTLTSCFVCDISSLRLLIIWSIVGCKEVTLVRYRCRFSLSSVHWELGYCFHFYNLTSDFIPKSIHTFFLLWPLLGIPAGWLLDSSTFPSRLCSHIWEEKHAVQLSNTWRSFALVKPQGCFQNQFRLFCSTGRYAVLLVQPHCGQGIFLRILKSNFGSVFDYIFNYENVRRSGWLSILTAVLLEPN